jgi:NhaP-type Na+/H+ or K+/H+ antiporter
MTDTSAAAGALTLATAAAAGIVSQSLAQTLHFPGIVLLLAVGVLLGPDVAGVIHPNTLGDALTEVVGFAVAVILFEGGLHLDVRKFRKRGRAINRLVTYGALITALGGTLAARFILGWEWRESALFGCLVIVTGPTVVTPLVRRFKLVSSVGTILEAEGVLIDAVGAVIAVVALEVAMEPHETLGKAVFSIAARLGLGALMGLIGGFILWALLRVRNLVAEGLENVVVLALIWALYEGAEAVVHESGIAAVTVAGLLLGNVRLRQQKDLLAFKNQLVVLLIGMLFVLLAADVRVADVLALGWRGVLVVAALVFVVRPVNVIFSTRGCSLSWRSRLYIAWLGPRGIIAAAVASLFAARLALAGLEGGEQLRAMVFLVIALTVVLAGLTGGPVAKLLSVSRRPRGWLLLGANALGCALAQALQEGGEVVTCIDSSVDHCQQASELGVDVIQGNALDEETLHRARVRLRAGVAALTPNDEVNLLFIEKAKAAGKVKTRLAALRSATLGATTEMVHAAGGQVLFGDDYDVELWAGRLRTQDAIIERMVASSSSNKLGHDEVGAALALPFALERGDRIVPVDDSIAIKKGDVVRFLVDRQRRAEVDQFLLERGWSEAPPRTTPEPPAKRPYETVDEGDGPSSQAT